MGEFFGKFFRDRPLRGRKEYESGFDYDRWPGGRRSTTKSDHGWGERFPRLIDFERMGKPLGTPRALACWRDIAHIAGLVSFGIHPARAAR